MGQKSLAPLHILEILKRHGDKEHPLTQGQLAYYLEKEYDVAMERKSVARNLHNLMAAGYPVGQTGKGVYLEDEREFDDSELLVLIDSVLFSKHISAKYAGDLIKKLQKLGSAEFRRTNRAQYRVEKIGRENAAGFFYAVEVIESAIGQNRKVGFHYNEYRLDKKLHDVYAELVTISPYRLVAANGHYYVIGKAERTGRIESFRVERMTDVQILQEEQSEGERDLFDLDKYLTEHPYLYAGEKADIKLKMNKRLAGELIDAFGKDFSVLEEGEETAVIALQAGFSDMLDWVKRFSEDVEVLSPQSLRNRLRKIGFPTAGKYLKSEEDRYARSLEYLQKQERSAHAEKCLFYDGIDLSQRTEYQRFVSCEKIALRDNNLCDVDFLHDFPVLLKVDIEKNPISDLSVLKGREELRELILKDTQVADLSFLEGMSGLETFEFEGKELRDLSPVYGLFNLQNLTIGAANVKKLDLTRLKRSCPNLQIKIGELDKDSPLEDVGKYFREGELRTFLRIVGGFAVGERAHILTREEVAAALSYLKEHEGFSGCDLQKTLRVGYPAATALLRWMADAGYIRETEKSRYIRIGEEGADGQNNRDKAK